MMNPIAPSNQPVKFKSRSKISSSLPDITQLQLNQIQADAVIFVAESHHKVSHRILKEFISDRFTKTRREAQRIISHLVAIGELSYTYEYGSSFLEVSFHRPMRVGIRMVLLPPGWVDPPDADCMAVRVQPGAAFGCGRHPTTRLALRGIEAVLLNNRRWWAAGNTTQALDIGTGSGILAIAALKFGIDRAIGIDRDACARAEAANNALLNHLGTRFMVTDKALHHLSPSGPFTLIMANLRYPTLLSLQGTIAGLLAPDGALVLSGIKSDEQARILSAYAEFGFYDYWSEKDKDWVGIVLRQSAS